MYQTTLAPVSNRADWTMRFELIDDDTGQIIDGLTDYSIQLDIRDPDCCHTLLTANTDAGTIVDTGGGVFEWRFTRSDMSRLCAGTYEIGVTIERDDYTTQFIIGTLPVLDGIVSR